MVSSGDGHRNTVLEAQMRAAGMSAADLAKALNEALLALTGRMGDLTDRTIRRLLSGQTRWPQTRQLLALEAVFGCTGEALGFTKPTRAKRKPTQEDPMQRRTFAAGAVAAVLPTPIAAPRRIGRADLERMQAGLDALSVQEQRSGGSTAVETEALTKAQMAVDLMNHGQTTTTIRRAIYSLAANATMAAAWAALDAHAMERAQRHLERALMLAGYSGDSVVTLRAWNYMALLSSQRNKPCDAQAAAERVRRNATTRRDPMYASLGHARYALALSQQQDVRGALRAIRLSEDALHRADATAPRPAWFSFYDVAEWHGLSSLVHLRIGRPDEAEFHVHQTLARIRPGFERNRAYYTAQLAIAQVKQGDLEQACRSADVLYTHGLPNSGRVRELLRIFRTEAAATGSKRARAWLHDTATTTL
ncbi:hypothetical protein ABZZ36_35035 [Actinacidiphila glaucinigra]|uniref:hypothetical protein n=1 Tax=Actinacidiphila glaucinigra TaxID=235986 RepID=UPI0033B3EEA9